MLKMMFYHISPNYINLPYKRVVPQLPSRLFFFEFQNFKSLSVFECEWGSYRFETILLYSPSRSLWTAPQRKGNVIQQHYKCTCNILYILINIVLLLSGCSIDFNFKNMSLNFYCFKAWLPFQLFGTFKVYM